jgi:hypothetical protein
MADRSSGSYLDGVVALKQADVEFTMDSWLTTGGFVLKKYSLDD